jgi:membrane fusion protein (multidrug efflux system)
VNTRHVGSLLFLFAAAAAGCSRADEAQHAPVVAVHTAAAAAASFAHVTGALGTVAPRAGRYAELSAPAATRVSHIYVAAGEPVAAGAPLVAFERGPFEAAARSAESGLASAQHSYDRAVRLTEAGVLPKKDLDLAAAELAQAQSAQVTAQRSLELATLRAPIAGVVTRMSAVLGAPVDPGQVVVAVADPSALDLLFAVSPADAAVIRRGAAVTVFAGEDARGEPLGAAQVTDIGAIVDSAARAVTVRARMTASHRDLRIGETVFGRITTGVASGAVVIPVAALVPEGEGYRVFVVDAGNIAHARAVTVGGRDEGRVEILSGLAAGETVVTDGAYGVEDSTHVVSARDSAPARP